MVTDFPAASSLSQLAGLTVTWLPLTVCSPFHSELSFVPAGRSNSSVQPDLARSVSLVTTYCPVYPPVQPLVLVYAAPTAAAWAVPVRAKTVPPITAAATTAPIALVLVLAVRRCVLVPIAFLPRHTEVGMREHASRPQTDKTRDPERS